METGLIKSLIMKDIKQAVSLWALSTPIRQCEVTRMRYPRHFLLRCVFAREFEKIKDKRNELGRVFRAPRTRIWILPDVKRLETSSRWQYLQDHRTKGNDTRLDNDDLFREHDKVVDENPEEKCDDNDVDWVETPLAGYISLSALANFIEVLDQTALGNNKVYENDEPKFWIPGIKGMVSRVLRDTCLYHMSWGVLKGSWTSDTQHSWKNLDNTHDSVECEFIWVLLDTEDSIVSVHRNLDKCIYVTSNIGSKEWKNHIEQLKLKDAERWLEVTCWRVKKSLEVVQFLADLDRWKMFSSYQLATKM